MSKTSYPIDSKTKRVVFLDSKNKKQCMVEQWEEDKIEETWHCKNGQILQLLFEDLDRDKMNKQRTEDFRSAKASKRGAHMTKIKLPKVQFDELIK